MGAYDGYRGGPETAIREAVQIPNNDPLLVIPAMAAVTEYLGFVATFSTTYEPPFAFARRASTLDHLTGRAVRLEHRDLVPAQCGAQLRSG